MDLSWLPELVKEINHVPAGLQIAFVGLLYFAVMRFTAWQKQRKAPDGAPAHTTQTAVEDMRKEIMPEIEGMKEALRDVEEQSQRVADIQLALATKIDNNTEKMIAINTNVENLVRR